jgi:putative hydrolase of the HAD superfamily
MQHLFFDVDGVIIDGFHYNPAYRRVWNSKIEKDLGIKEEDFVNRFVKKHFAPVIVGEKDLLDSLTVFLKEINSNKTALQVMNYWHEKDSLINSSIAIMIESLREGDKYRFHLATNQDHNRAKYLWNQLELKEHFENIFYSADLKVLKSNPLFFNKIVEKLKLDPNQCIQIDDNPEVIESAQKAGWKTILVEDPYDTDSLKTKLIALG